MRLKSDIWVSALIRRANGAGAFAAVRRRGAEEAGAIFVRISTLDGNAALYGPAPPTLDDEASPERRLAVILPPGTPEGDVEERMRREMKFDSDLWFIEIEDRQGRVLFDLA